MDGFIHPFSPDYILPVPVGRCRAVSEMKDLCLWFLTQLPDFLMSEPVCYFVGFAMLFVVIGLFKSIINIK